MRKAPHELFVDMVNEVLALHRSSVTAEAQYEWSEQETVPCILPEREARVPWGEGEEHSTHIASCEYLAIVQGAPQHVPQIPR